MREEIAECGRVVALAREANDALTEEIEFERAQLRDKHVDAHVPLCASYK